MSIRQSTLATLRQKVHRATYLSLQTLRQRPVGAHMRELAKWERLSPADYEALCRQRLLETLQYAKAKVPDYSSGAWTGARADDLASWPVLTRSYLQDHLDTINTKRGQKLVYRTSSASTAKPVRTPWEGRGIAWAWANEYQGLRWHGIGIATLTLMLWAREEPFVNRVLNRSSFYNTAKFTPEELERAAQQLIRLRPPLLWAMPSPAAQLARHIGVHHPDAPRPLAGVAKIGGEQVYPFQRAEIERYLGARVVEVYGCSELGTVAMECPHGSMHIFAPTVHIEIMRDDQPVKPGEVGDIVATSLVNRAAPLVRYRNGDRARLSPQRCPCGLPHPVLFDLQSRNTDVVLAADGRQVHASAIGKAMEEYVGVPGLGTVRLVRFEQIDARHWKVTAEAEEAVMPTLREQATQLTRSLFGDECQVQVETVRFLPREPSGKFRYYKTMSMPDSQGKGVQVDPHARVSGP